MPNLQRRVLRLEERLSADLKEGITLTVSYYGVKLALDSDKCVEILRECGHLRTAPAITIVNFGRVPDALNAKELETYLRRRGHELCNGGSGSQRPSGGLGRGRT